MPGDTFRGPKVHIQLLFRHATASLHSGVDAKRDSCGSLVAWDDVQCTSTALASPTALETAASTARTIDTVDPTVMEASTPA